MVGIGLFVLVIFIPLAYNLADLYYYFPPP